MVVSDVHLPELAARPQVRPVLHREEEGLAVVDVAPVVDARVDNCSCDTRDGRAGFIVAIAVLVGVFNDGSVGSADGTDDLANGQLPTTVSVGTQQRFRPSQNYFHSGTEMASL